MKRVLITGAATTALLFAGAPMAFAQDAEPADCAAATVALNKAQASHDSAVAADKAFADAKAADEALADAEREAAEALRAVQQYPVHGVTDERSAREIRDEIRRLLENNTSNETVDVLERKLELVNAYIQASERLEDAADEAEKADVGPLRIEAEKTDVGETRAALNAAQDDVNRLCGGTPAPPVPFENCAEVRAAGYVNGIISTNPRFNPALDSDKDGIGCEVEIAPGNGSNDSNSNSDRDSSVRVVPNDAPETGDGSTEAPFSLRAALGAIMLNFFAVALAAHFRGGAHRL